MKFYEDEEINHGGNLVFGIFILISIYSLFGAYNQYQNGDFSSSIFWMIAVLFISFILISLFIVLSNILNAISNRKKVELIKTKGIKVKGHVLEIIKSETSDYSFFKKATFIRKYPVFKDETRKRETFYFAKVEYELNNKKKTVKTPSLNFTDKYLGKNNVDVYVYKNKVYVDNYKIDAVEKVTNELSYLKTTIIIIGLFIVNIILSSIALLLDYNNVISGSMAFMIFIALMIIYFIITGFLYYKLTFKK